MEGGGEVEVVGQLLGEQHLGVLLEVEVDLIFVELTGFTNRAVGVVGAVRVELFAADAVPSVVGFFATTEEDELQRGTLVEISALEEIRSQACRGAIAVAVGGEVRQTGVERPMIAEEAGADFHGVFRGGERAERRVDRGVRQRADAVGGHVDAGTEGGCAVGGGADTALELDVVDGGNKVGGVYPVEGVGFGIVEGDAVVGHVDAFAHRAAHTNAGVADAVTGVGGGHYARERRKQEGDILSEVHALDGFFVQIRKRQRRGLRGTVRHHACFVETRHANTVGTLCRHAQDSAPKGCPNLNFVHVD